MQTDVEETREVLPAVSTSAREARRIVVDFLSQRGAFRPLEPAAVIVTELVANAVLFGGGDTIEVVARMGDRAIRIEVHDDNPAPPTRRMAATTDCVGRGLALIEALATRWGVARDRAGKWVWADLPR